MKYRALVRFLESLEPLFQDAFGQIAKQAVDVLDAEPWIRQNIYYTIVDQDFEDVLVRAQTNAAQQTIEIRFSSRVVDFDKTRVNLLYLSESPRYEPAVPVYNPDGFYEVSYTGDEQPYAVVIYDLRYINPIYESVARWLPGGSLISSKLLDDPEDWALRVRAAYQLLTSGTPFSASVFAKYIAVVSGVPIAVREGIISSVEAAGDDAVVYYSDGSTQRVKGYGTKIGRFRKGVYIEQYEPLTTDLEVIVDEDIAE
jgi:hypothetical protein